MQTQPDIPTLEDIQNLLSQGQSTKALAALYAHYLPSDDQLVCTVYADALLHENQDQAALSIYLKAARQGGAFALRLWKRVLETNFRLQNIDQCILALRHALSLNPSDMELHQQEIGRAQA